MDPAIVELIDDAYAAVEEEFGRVAATYARGESLTCELSLLLTDYSGLQMAPDEAVSVHVHETMFLADPQDLDFGDGPTDPLPGDVITFALDGVSYQFAVESREGGPCWAPWDAYRRRTQIYAKQIARGRE
jgi:hypothetical protein